MMVLERRSTIQIRKKEVKKRREGEDEFR